MKELPRSLRATIIHQLVELLRTEASSWQTVAMVILSKLLECTELGDELDCVVSLFASYLRSPCLGMQSLVLRAILGLTERPTTVSGGSWQRQECRGLGWAGPGLLWLGTLPGSGEGKGCWAGWESVFAQGAVIAFPKGRCFVHTGEANARPAAEHHGAAAGCRQRHPHCRSAHAQHHAVAPGGRTLSPAALELAGKLPALFGDDSSTVRLLSIRLFLDTLGFVEGSQEKLQQVAHRSLLPLSFHLHDQDESVAEASREALLGVARFLRWRQLAHLAEMLQSWKISECLLARRSSAAEEYLAQSLPYLQSLQEPLRQEAVRFTVLRGLANDPCESVSSLAIQTG
eukprot:XP_027302998.1 uncharacterized protein LOC113840448 [Anas platyrhynchos]